MRLPRPLHVAASVAILFVAASAGAEPKIHEMDPIKVSVKPARPLVTEIANPQKNLASPAEKQPVASKVEAAISTGPF